MREVTLQEILQAREDRVKLQQRLLHEFHCPLICFTMNIPGPIKNTPLIQRGFQAGLHALEHSIADEYIVNRVITQSHTGDTAFLSVKLNADELKAICISIENRFPLGRLFDMDVLDTNGYKLTREIPRGCIVCGAPGRHCAAGRLHPVAELQHATNRILTNHFYDTDPEYIASFAVQSLIEEVNTTPKPGLVDRRNNGSHKDMTIHHFMDSAKALGPYFAQCVRIGQETAQQTPQQTFSRLRQSGIAAEKTMYETTGGINTHKGVIYTLGVLCGAIGRLWSAEVPIADVDFILTECAKIVGSSVAEDFAEADGSTAGERLYSLYGIGGIRAEVAAGLPSVATIGLPTYRRALEDGLIPNDAGVITLLHLISHVADTNLYHRGGVEGAKWAAHAAQKLLSTQPHPTVDQVQGLDDAFIARNLSPGGCADLLAVTYFLHHFL